MKPNSYTQPPGPPFWKHIEVRPLLPIYPPPEPLARPALPTPQRTASFSSPPNPSSSPSSPSLSQTPSSPSLLSTPTTLPPSPYTLSTHILPACYLRTGRYVPIPALPGDNVEKNERARILKEYARELLGQRGPMRTDGYPKVLWNVVNRYVKRGLEAGQGKGLTLFFAHANGFPKETWEPTVANLLASPVGAQIDEVWCWEAVQHGDANLLNRGSLSKFFDWQDNTRDIVNFLTNYLPSRAGGHLPLHLERVPESESKRRIESGYAYRRIMAVGHSYGGCTSTLAAENYPKLFTSLVLVDPVIAKPFITEEIYQDQQAKTDLLLMGSLTRRDTWGSREEVLETFNKNPFFLAWHPEVLKVYVEAGTHVTTDSEGREVVKLKAPGIYESIVFAERYVSQEAWEGLPSLDEGIPLRWVLPGRADANEFGPPGSARERAWVRPKNSSNIVFPGASHLIPQERPVELAEDLYEFIVEHYGRQNMRACL